MKNNDAYDPDSCGEDYAGQPPDDDQSFIVPRRGLEPDSGPDDEPMIVERRGSPATWYSISVMDSTSTLSSKKQKLKNH